MHGHRLAAQVNKAVFVNLGSRRRPVRPPLPAAPATREYYESDGNSHIAGRSSFHMLNRNANKQQTIN